MFVGKDFPFGLCEDESSFFYSSSCGRELLSRWMHVYLARVISFGHFGRVCSQEAGEKEKLEGLVVVWSQITTSNSHYIHKIGVKDITM